MIPTHHATTQEPLSEGKGVRPHRRAHRKLASVQGDLGARQGGEVVILVVCVCVCLPINQ